MSALQRFLAFQKRSVNVLYGKIVIPHIEKEMSFDDGREKLHYLFYKKKSDVLIVGFQAFNEKGARYNYVTPLMGSDANRLYIKDDFVEICGNYYLGRNNQYNIEKAVFELIDKIREETKAKKLIFIGSSKGGYAAINFGIHYENAVIIVAAPQYHLGSYMNDGTTFRKGLEDIVSLPVTPEKVAALDRRLPEKIRQDRFGASQKAYIHCSVNENTYKNHVKDLIQDLEDAGVSVEFDAGEYSEHWQLKQFFPNYLCSVIEKEAKV